MLQTNYKPDQFVNKPLVYKLVLQQGEVVPFRNQAEWFESWPDGLETSISVWQATRMTWKLYNLLNGWNAGRTSNPRPKWSDVQVYHQKLSRAFDLLVLLCSLIQAYFYLRRSVEWAGTYVCTNFQFPGLQVNDNYFAACFDNGMLYVSWEHSNITIACKLRM